MCIKELPPKRSWCLTQDGQISRIEEETRGKKWREGERQRRRHDEKIKYI